MKHKIFNSFLCVLGLTGFFMAGCEAETFRLQLIVSTCGVCLTGLSVAVFNLINEEEE